MDTKPMMTPDEAAVFLKARLDGGYGITTVSPMA